MSEAQIPQNTYETETGTEPRPHVTHEPRTIKHERTNSDDDTVNMMSEIGDGTFVAWGNCRKCRHRVAHCTCPSGPVEPEYITGWRGERFDKELSQRPELPFTLLPSVTAWLNASGYCVAKPEDLASVLEAAQEAQDAAYGDSNDAEINLLRDALEAALGALGLGLPEGVDPDDEGGEDETEDLEILEDEARQDLESSVFERPPGNVHVLPVDTELADPPLERPTRSVDTSDIQVDF